MERRRTVVAAQVMATFVVVLSLYAGPIALSAALGLVDTFDGADTLWVDRDDDVREAVFWSPPEETMGDEDAESSEEAPAVDPSDDAPSEVPPETEETPPSNVAPTDTLAVASGTPTASSRSTSPNKARRVVRRRSSRHPVTASGGERTRIRTPLTKKQVRKRDRRRKRRERRAERKQCAELIDQLVQVDDDSWWVGRELINCYRVHPQQFVMMGGAWWHEEKGRKRGVRIHVSSRSRGDVARKAGFRKGDVVRSINGVPIRFDLTGALAATQLLRGKGRVRITRDGEKRVLRYKVVGEKRLEEKRVAIAALAQAEEALEPPARPRSLTD